MKRRIIVVLGLLLGLSTFVGSASSVTFSLRPTVTPVLPSATTPNLPGTVVVSALLTAPPAVPETRDLAQLQALWQSAGQAYGIPWQVLAAINKVESNFGRNMGPSSAGAIGWMQFMPSTWERWGMDANGDGVADPWSPEDADLLRGALPRRLRRGDRHPERDLRLQPRRLVRERGAGDRGALRHE